MLCVKDNITGGIYYTEDFGLRDVLEQLFDPCNYWAEAFLNIVVEED